jgi:hypothetical protein
MSQIRKMYGDDVADAICKVGFTINNKKQIVDFTPDLDIEYNILEDQLSEQPARFAFWSMILSEQKCVVDKLKLKLRIRRSSVFQKTIEAARAIDRKIPKYELDEIVENDKKIIELSLDLLKEEKTLSKMYGIVESMRIKSDNLRSLAGFKKQELMDARNN